MFIAKFCINIAFFGCRTHFSHITESPHASPVNEGLNLDDEINVQAAVIFGLDHLTD